MKPMISSCIVAALLSSTACGQTSEITPAPSAPCFPGAYYRKAVSSLDHWTGIEAIVKLPNPEYDANRLKPSGRPIDNASIYLGGNSNDQEIDCGVNWEIIRETDGSVSKVGKAFRPFWRNEKWFSGPANPDYYFYPGDVIRIKVENTQHGKLLMRIDLLARAGTPAAEIRPQVTADETTPIVASRPVQKPQPPLTTMPTDAITSFTTVFDATGFRKGGLQQYKRVNGLDQSGNEGNPVQPTSTRIADATWQEVWLLRDHKRVPMTPERFTDMRCPDAKHITVSRVGLSGENVTITGNPDSK